MALLGSKREVGITGASDGPEELADSSANSKSQQAIEGPLG